MNNGSPGPFPPPPNQPPGGGQFGPGAQGGPGAPQYGEGGPQYGSGAPQYGSGAPQYGQGSGAPQYGQGSGAPQYGAPAPQGGFGSGPQQAPTPAPGGPNFTQPNGPQQKKSRKPLIVSLIAVALVLVLLVVGLIVVNTVNKNQYGPDKVALEYLNALEAGDFAAAENLAKPNVPETASRVLLDPKYVKASPDKMSDVTVKDTQVEGDNATVNATYALAGNTYDIALKATKDGKQGLFFDNWKLAAPALSALTIPAPQGMTTKLNGEEFTAEEASTEYAVYPGTYQVEVESTKYVEGAKDETTVALGDEGGSAPTEVTLPLQPTGALNDDVQKQVEAKVSKCAKDIKDVETSAKDSCPFFIAAGGANADEAIKDIKDGSMDWKVDRQPTVKVTLNTDGTGATFYTSKNGEMSYKAKSKRPNYEWSGRGGPIVMSGSVSIEGDKVSLKFT